MGTAPGVKFAKVLRLGSLVAGEEARALFQDSERECRFPLLPCLYFTPEVPFFHGATPPLHYVRGQAYLLAYDRSAAAS